MWTDSVAPGVTIANRHQSCFGEGSMGISTSRSASYSVKVKSIVYC